jgi:hypothetical protein
MATIKETEAQALLTEIDALRNAIKSAGEPGRALLTVVDPILTSLLTQISPGGGGVLAAGDWDKLTDDQKVSYYTQLLSVRKTLSQAAGGECADVNSIMSSACPSNVTVVILAAFAILGTFGNLWLIRARWSTATASVYPTPALVKPSSPRQSGPIAQAQPNAPPVIAVSPTSFAFTTQQGAANPTDQLSISNTGGGTLSWNVTAASSSGGNWLSISPSSGTGNSILTLSANISKLSPGSYSGSIQVSAAGATNSPQSVGVDLTVEAPCAQYPSEVNVLLMIMLMGSLGGFIHLSSSFAQFVGNRQLRRSWILYYIFMPLEGAALALLLYLLLRIGVLAGPASASSATSCPTANLNFVGLYAFAGLTGLFTKQAIEMLADVFSTIFKKVQAKDPLIKTQAASSVQQEPPTQTGEKKE